MNDNAFENYQQIFMCNRDTVGVVRKYAHMLILFLRETSFLVEAYILDYFVEELWTRFPSTWLDIVKDFETEDLEVFLSSDKDIRYKQPWPLSLLSFRACSFSLALPRKSIKSLKCIETFLIKHFLPQGVKLQATNFSEKSEWDCIEDEFKHRSGQHKSIPEFCRRHVKAKKQHEIFRMAQLADVVLRIMNVKHLIDIGSGQGHLSRLLALCYNLNVATIEAKQCHVSGAVNFDKQALSSMKRLKACADSLKESCSDTNALEVLPHHLEGSMTLESSKDYLEKVLKNTWRKDACDISQNEIALLGLHTCGDLASTILQMFAESHQTKVLVSVGCCYMKLNENKEYEGYPLSSFIRSLDHHNLSYEAREMACHALEMYIQRLKDNSPALKIHCYRAALEKCIVHHYPKFKHMGLRGVKHAEHLDFSEYAEKALSKVECSIPKEFLMSTEIQSCLKQWKDVLKFYSLRLMVAPIIESLILVDKVLYLLEKGYASCIVPIFDPTKSPRNHVIISAKVADMNI